MGNIKASTEKKQIRIPSYDFLFFVIPTYFRFEHN